MKVMIEYQAARKQGIKEALAFDPSGRPGASAVRERQDSLRRRIALHRGVTEARIGPLALPGGRYFRPDWTSPQYQFLRSGAAAEPYRNHRHATRQAKVDAWLREIDWWRNEISIGCPNMLFGWRSSRGDLSARGVSSLGSGWWYRKIENAITDWDRYSKAWHRTHGPAVTVERRAVEFRRWAGKPGYSEIEIRTAEMAAWRGDWLASAVKAVGLAPERPNAPMTVRLNAAYDAHLVETRHGYRIYQRTLVGKPIDWAVVAPMGTTYHHSCRTGLIRGLHNKMRRSTLRLDGRLVDWAKCRALGFCGEGIKSFCSDFGLSTKKAYSPEEIATTVRSRPQLAAPYIPQLRVLARAVGFTAPELA